MNKDIKIAGATYSGVPAIKIPAPDGGTVRYTEVSDTTATAADVASGKVFYDASGNKATGTGSGSSGGNDSYNQFFEFCRKNSGVRVLDIEGAKAYITSAGGNGFDADEVDYTRILDLHGNKRPYENYNGFNFSLQEPQWNYTYLHTISKLRLYAGSVVAYKVEAVFELKELYYCGLDKTDYIQFDKYVGEYNECFSAFQKLKKIIIDSTDLISCTDINGLLEIPAYTGDGDGAIYVPDALVDSYKKSTNWATVASHIKPISEYEAAGGWNYNFTE